MEFWKSLFKKKRDVELESRKKLKKL